MLRLKSGLNVGLVLMLSMLLVISGQVIAAEHVVSSDDLHSAVAEQQSSRAENLKAVDDFLTNETFAAAVKDAGADPAKVQQAVATLSDEELAAFASQTQQVQQDFAAGAISHRNLTLIIGAVIIIVLIIAIAA